MGTSLGTGQNKEDTWQDLTTFYWEGECVCVVKDEQARCQSGESRFH